MTFTLATPDHEAMLRRLACEEAMPGWVRLAYAREPNWFHGQEVLGHLSQTMVALDDTAEVIGCGVRAVRKAYINGRAADIGYLCGLRSLPRVRGSLALAHAYRFFRRLHVSDGRTQAYLTTIVDDNVEAIRVLTSGRATLPAYQDRGRFITTAILLGRRRPRRPPEGLEVHTGAEVPLERIVEFLRKEGPRRQFFPVLEPSTFDTPQWRGFAPASFRVALRREQIVGVTAGWDQSAFRQVVVAGYAPALRITRPIVNLALAAVGRRPVPAPGQELKFFHAVFSCVRENDSVVFAALLERLFADNRRSPYDCFVVGLHECDPLRAALRGFPSFEYVSRLYLACWEDGRPFCETLDPSLIPHLETALL